MVPQIEGKSVLLSVFSDFPHSFSVWVWHPLPFEKEKWFSMIFGCIYALVQLIVLVIVRLKLSTVLFYYILTFTACV